MMITFGVISVRATSEYKMYSISVILKPSVLLKNLKKNVFSTLLAAVVIASVQLWINLGRKYCC